MHKPNDQFSEQAELYQKFRPTYPTSLYRFIYTQCAGFDVAWDCGTGNGQVAIELSERFSRVYATDISENQLRQAIQRPNVVYSNQQAEKTKFSDESFDLICVAQAMHWFNFEAFNKEVHRLLKKGGVIAVWGYSLVRINEEIDRIVDEFYWNQIHGYWSKERKYVEEGYTTIPFSYPMVDVDQDFSIELEWRLDHFIGYLRSWSAVRNYIRENGEDPVLSIEKSLENSWGDGERTVRFPVFLKLGKKNE